MKEVITQDNSITFYNEEYNETYHSVTGAIEEAYKKFAEPALEAVKGKSEIRILDVCFGLGYNSAAALDMILKHNFRTKISIVGLEKDKQILEKIKEVQPGIMSYHVIQDTVENNYSYDREGIRVEIKLGDALKTIKTVKKTKAKFDIIFLDPFSPKKNPELWTQEFFKELRKLIKPEGILLTYSCAGQVRRNLKAAGFTVKDGPCIGRRSPSTIALPDKK